MISILLSDLSAFVVTLEVNPLGALAFLTFLALLAYIISKFKP